MLLCAVFGKDVKRNTTCFLPISIRKSEQESWVITLHMDFILHTSVLSFLIQIQGVERAQLFVQDFVLTQLIEKDLANIISEAVHDPMGLLADILEREDRGSPEPRFELLS